jgi:hypothetical protein
VEHGARSGDLAELWLGVVALILIGSLAAPNVVSQTDRAGCELVPVVRCAASRLAWSIKR